MPINDVLAIWDAVFFTQQSSLTICVFRIAAGCLMAIESLQWVGYYFRYISTGGYLNHNTYREKVQRSRFSLLGYLPVSDLSVKIVVLMQFCSALFLLCGIYPQLSALVCFIATTSIHNRNPFVLDSGDAVRRYFCLLLVFAPTGTQLSFFHSGDFIKPQEKSWSWHLVLIRFFIANIYMKNVLFKISGRLWRNGTAAKIILGVRVWNRFNVPAFLNKKWFYSFTTYAVLVIETLLFAFIWIDEFRPFVIVLGILFHLGLWLVLKIGFFQLTMICGLLCFIKPREYLSFFMWAGIY